MQRDVSYCVIIGDIVRSRTLTDRQTAQRTLTHALTKTAELYRSHVAVGPVLTAGDEFEIVCSTPSPAVSIALDLTLAVAPVRLRFGIGIGSITTDLADRPTAMDGPAFHRARAALEQCKRLSPARIILFDTSSELADEVLNAIMVSVSRIVLGWSSRQQELVSGRRRFKTEAELAQSLSLNKSTVNRTLHRAHLHELDVLVAAASRVTEELHKYMQQGVGCMNSCEVGHE